MKGIIVRSFLLCLLGASLVLAAEGRKPYQENPRPAWLDKGLVLGWGNHEAFIFRVRRGGNLPYDELWKQFEAEHSEQTVIEAQKAGIEVFHTHGYKGFGYEAEKKEMDMLKTLSGYVHKHGMKLDTYCQVMTIVPETFQAEVPQVMDWVQRDASGIPIMLTYDHQQSYRPKPNLGHPDYRKYYKEKIIKTLVQDVGSDLLHFDNFDCNAEPESDHSPVNVAGFHAWLKNKFTPEKMIERFGHANYDLVMPPIWNMENPPAAIREILDPAQQEWIDYRCWLMADWLRDITTYARSLNPNVAFDTNPHGLFGRNRAFQAALWHPWFMKYSEVMWSEETNPADYTQWGTIVSKIRSYKLGRTLDNYVLTYKADALMLAEGLAFNQTLGNIDLRPGDDPVNRKYYDFFIANRDLYTGTLNREDVATLRSYATMAYDNHRAALEQCMFEQAMIQAQVSFDLVFDEQMDDLSRYRVLVLAGQNNLSDENVAKIKKFVAAGGSLVFTGLTGSRDQWLRRRSTPALNDLLGLGLGGRPGRRGGAAAAGAAYSNKTEVSADGRVVYVPAIVPPDKEQAENWTGSWDGNMWEGTWIRPANWRELEEAVRQAAGGRLSLETELPDWVAVEQVQKDKRILVHLVNYLRGNRLSGIPVDLALDRGKGVSSVKVISPDREGARDIPFQVQGGRCTFRVPELETYDVVVVEQK